MRKTIATRLAGIAAGLAALALAACSSNAAGHDPVHSGAAKNDSSSAAAALAKYTGPVSLKAPGPAFDASAARGKTVWWVTQLGANPFLATLGANFKQALGRAGVTVLTCDGQGNPVQYNACIQKAIAQHPAAIEVDGPEAKTYATQLAAAQAAHIPVFSGAAVDASGALYTGLAGQTSQPFELTGRLAADWIAKDSGGGAHVLFLTVPDVIGSVQEQQAFSSELARVCGGCAATVKGVTLANWATDLGPTTSAALQRDPRIDYVVPAFDPMAAFTGPAISQAGKSASVKVVTVNGSLQQMQALKAGQNVNAEIGIDMYALGYIEADQVLRVLAGQPALSNDTAPVRVFTKADADTLTLTASAQQDGSWFVDPTAYADMFVTLWKGGASK